MKYMKLNATIEAPDDIELLDVVNFLTDAIEDNHCEWCVSISLQNGH